MNRKAIVQFVVLVVVVMLLVAASVVSMFPANPQAQSELLDFHKQLNLRDSKQTVKSAFVALDSKFLKLVPIEKEVWRVETPYEFGATNWFIYIEFQDDETIHAIRVRTHDSPNMHPPDAPADVADE